MKHEDIHTLYFLGIGGIGMSALARYFAHEGYCILGHDRTSTPLTKQLETEGMDIRYDACLDDVLSLDPAHTLVVRTPAVPEDDVRLAHFRQHGFAVAKRAEVLGWVTRHKKALCVAGTHGKTTTTTMLAHLLQRAHIASDAFLGGIANNYQTNILLNDDSEYVVVEADEFDRSFHHLMPHISVITSMDPDHLDIYGTAAAYRESFATYEGLVEVALVVKASVAQWVMEAVSPQCRVYRYGVKDGEEAMDFYADQVRVNDGTICFDFYTPEGVVADVQLGVPAWVNIENAVAAMAVAWLVGARDEALREGMRSFAGVYRRFNIHINTPRVAYIDDYAHHPTELKATIESVKRLYPDREVIGVFQPHLYSRTRDFADDFAAVLSELDEVVLLPIYPAREAPIAGVTSEWLMEKIQKRTIDKVSVMDKKEVVAYLRERVASADTAGVVLTLGAGDIDTLIQELTNNIL
jgi:UDP-N-acetylmuramate--alanine ligase